MNEIRSRNASLGRTKRSLLAATCLWSLAGCQVFGPGAIEYGRFNYNEVIQETNKEQLFINIIRVLHNEITAFMDVTEIDATVLSNSSITGGVTGLGAGKGSAALGSLSANLQYEESPIIRYIPLLGQALISQLSTPISIDSLGNMLNSGWPVAAVLDLALDRLTPNVDDHEKALQIIQDLWEYDVLIVTGGVAQTTKAAADSTKPPQDDSLILYFNPAALKSVQRQTKVEELKSEWAQLQSFYQGTQENIGNQTKLILRNIANGTKTKGVSLPAPVILTRSALGLLREAVGSHFVAIIPPDILGKILGHNCGGFYRAQVDVDTRNIIGPAGCDNTYHTARAYLLIAESGSLPSDAYVSYFAPRLGHYFYIANDDKVSQQNFTLINLFMTIQAAPPPAPLTPTITTGPRSGG